MRIFEVGTGYTSIPADKGAATEIVVENLARSLIRLGHDVTIFDIADSRRLPTDLPIHEVRIPGPLSFTDESLGIKHKLKRVLYSLALSRSLSSALREMSEGERVVIHFHNQYNAYFFFRLIRPSLRRRAFVVYTNHSYIWHDAWEDIRDTVKSRYFQEVRAMQESDLCFVLNDPTFETLSGPLRIPADHISRIANGVDIRSYRPLASTEIETIKDGLGLNGKRVIIQVGSICERKNQLGAFELLAPFLKENDDLVYLFVGGVIDEEYKTKLLARAAEEGVESQVIYGGEIAPGEQLNRYYNVADAMLFPAISEAFGLVIIEAMAAGVPAIVPSQLNVNLQGYDEFANEDEFRQLFASRILDPAEHDHLAALARETAESTYSWDAVAQDYASAILDRMVDDSE